MDQDFQCFYNPQQGENVFKKFALDPQFGSNIPENYQPRSFVKTHLIQCLNNLDLKIRDKKVQQTCKNLKPLGLDLKNKQIDNFTRQRDCLYLHGLLTILLSAFLVEKREQQLKDSQIIVPYNLGIALYEVANFLQIQYGKCEQVYCNWRLRQGLLQQLGNKQLNLSQFRRMFYYTHGQQDQKDQELFFGGNFIGRYYLFKCIKLLVKLMKLIYLDPMNCQDQCISSFIQIQKYLKLINKSNQYILNNMTQTFLLQKLRKYLKGFEGIKIQNTQITMTSGGAAGGFDPSFQIFQRAIGITYQQGPLSKTQQMLRTGFSKETRKLVFLMEKHSIIKQFCQLSLRVKPFYNRAIIEYGKFFIFHKHFIKRFLTSLQPNSFEGVAGLNYSHMQKRDEQIKKKTI